MEKIDEFKSFVKDNPVLIKYVKSNEMTWQKFYEIYDLYGKDYDVWKQYLTDNISSETNSSDNKKNVNMKELLNMAKSLDVDKVQNGINSLQKALGLFGDLVLKKDTDTKPSSYQPRPIYKSFED